MKCAVLNCKSDIRKHQTNLKFFRFPQDAQIYQQWKNFCRKDEIGLDEEFMCIFHFKSTDFERDLRYEMGFTKRYRPKLLPTAVPTIRPNSTANLDSKAKKIVQSLPRKITVSHHLENSSSVVENEIETDPLILEIKVESEMISETYEKPTAELVNIKSEPEDLPPHEIEIPCTNGIVENTEMHPMQMMRKQLKIIKKENLILRKAAKQYVATIGDLNRTLKKSEFLRMNVEKNLRLMFTEGQIKKLKNGTEKRLIWSEEDLKKAAELYSISRKAYELLQKNNHPLPSVRTIQFWMNKSKPEGSNQPKEESKTERVLYKPKTSSIHKELYHSRDPYKFKKCSECRKDNTS